jgi:hypothetical protein
MALDSAVDALSELLSTLVSSMIVSPSGGAVGTGVGGSVGIAQQSTWDTFTLLGVLTSVGVEDSVCDAVGEVVIHAHDDAVPLHCLGSVLLLGGVPPVIALRAVNQLVQVREPIVQSCLLRYLGRVL